MNSYLNRLYFIFFLLCFCFPLPGVFADNANIELTGKIEVRFPSSDSFEVATASITLPVNTLLRVCSDYHKPLATDSKILVGSLTIVLFPGCLLKKNDEGYKILTGRIKILSQSELPKNLIFKSDKFVCEFAKGELLLEKTAQGEWYVVLLDKGIVWVKDFARRMYKLKPRSEIFFPEFGVPDVKKRISSRWKTAPEGFAHREIEQESKKKNKEDEEDSEKLLSASETDDSNAESNPGLEAESDPEQLELQTASESKIVPESEK